jgi:hypothetical protein
LVVGFLAVQTQPHGLQGLQGLQELQELQELDRDLVDDADAPMYVKNEERGFL